MAIRIEDEYPYSTPASADYPGGSFKNDSTGSTGDGTPLDNKWANDFLGFFQALLSTAGIVPSGAPDTAQASQYLEALQTLAATPSDMKFVMRSTPGPRWLEANGGTIGDATSGASERANADTAALFKELWNLSPLQLYTSAGVPVARGATAADDFAAHRRIKLPDMRGRDAKGWDHGRGSDPGRVLGSDQTDAIRNIVGYHGLDDRAALATVGAFVGGPGPGAEARALGGFYGDTTASGGDGNNVWIKFDASLVVPTADENRTKNVAGMWIIRY